MRPATMARDECANYEKGGTCIGMNIRDNLPFGTACLLASRQQCKYFEEYVLPMADSVRDPFLHKEYSEAKQVYYQ